MVMTEFLLLMKYLVLCAILAFIIFYVPLLLVLHKPESEKMSTYECGFNPFGDARSKFSIKYYLICVLFLIFDLELSYLFPFIIAYYEIGWIGETAMFIFLMLLTFGFWYEWTTGALDW